MPIFLDDLGGFEHDAGRASRAALRVHAETPVSDHLEIETYTWDVLPAHLKDGDIVDYVARELDWIRDELRAATLSR